MTPPLMGLLLNTGAFVAILMLAAWLVSLPLKNASIADIVWGFGFVLIAWVAFFTFNRPLDMQQALLVGIPTFWGLRLSLHLFRRNLGKPEDERYHAMRAKHPNRFGWVSLVTVFGLQGLLMFVVSLPVQLGQIGPLTPLTWSAYAGVAMCVVGLFFEVVGDYQLAQFTKNPSNKGMTMNTGLWRYTRHPNYFGDSCLWWGLGLIALSTQYGTWGLLGPILITYLLTQVSGVPMLEKAMLKSNPRYADYMAVTSAFIPWPPKKQGQR
jgi:steroid 5-alpha reductase family enzyme